jgi:hypothetical protein
VHDELAVHIINTLANLANELNAIALCQCEVVGNNSLEKLATRDAVEKEIGYQSNEVASTHSM